MTGPVRAQQLIGYVSTRDADVTGAKDVLDGRAVLMGSVSVTARDHTAPISAGPRRDGARLPDQRAAPERGPRDDGGRAAALLAG